uniref:Uncharacterized protein n=1 Tax=viral metagenome TaxID=1070528 RepID=A0A6M3JN58_9ZZZZ
MSTSSEEVSVRIKWTEMFYAGKRQATEDFAWWKDGTQYVGCGIKTLKRILQEYDEAEKRDIEYIKTGK